MSHPVFRSFASNSDGNVAVIFGLTILPITLLVGSAIDYTGANRMLTSLQANIDKTALTLCKTPGNSAVADIRAQALIALNSGSVGAPVTITDFKSTEVPRTISMTARATYKTAVMQIAQVPTIDVAASATCSSPETFFEIALVLDTTGSMDTAGKIGSAKTAATDFVNYMFTKGAMPDHVRMSLVPFSATVAVPSSYKTAAWMDTTGISPNHWRNITSPVSNSTTPKTNFANRFDIFDRLKTADSSWSWGGCVESPSYPYNVKDDAVSSATPASLIVPYLAIDELSTSASENSYIDDGYATGGSATCRSDDPSNAKRITQACKYQSPKKKITGTALGPNWRCNARPLSILGTSQPTLLSEISQLTPLGTTNIHEGLMWGWRTLSPTSVFGKEASPPVPYAKTSPEPGQPVYRKIIVLMTDGDNTWYQSGGSLGSQPSAYGYFKNADGSDPAAQTNSRMLPGRTKLTTDTNGRDAINELTLAACANAKAKGVTIYTVGFSVAGDQISAVGQSLLQKCASGSDYFFIAKSGTELQDAFSSIAKAIGALRIMH